ncbi:MAG: ABC transporter permease, partial [Bacteroidota bacterium]
MLRNYLKLALRTLAKYRVYGAINLLGLSLGISLSGFLLLYVQQEFSFDRHIPDHERIYRISWVFHDRPYAVAPEGLTARLQVEYSGIERAINFRMETTELQVPERDVSLDEFQVAHADAGYFDLFPGNPLIGDPKKALGEEGKAVLTESLAKQLFGYATPVGETILVSSSRTDKALPYTVGSVVADVELPQHLNPQIWIHSPGFQDQILAFHGASFVSYAKVREGQSPDYLDESIRNLYEQVEYYDAGVASSLEEWRTKANHDWQLISLADIHFEGGGG